MSNIEKTLSALQPYVIGIRYLDGVPVVDTVFKDGWTLPESDVIKRAKGNDELNYYMIFSEKNGVGLDDLLLYVNKTIKLNLEREKKHELLREKVNELKELFKKNSLVKLKCLKFVLDEELVPKIDDFNLDDDEIDNKIEHKVEQHIVIEKAPIIDNSFVEEIIPSNNYLDENGKPIELTQEDQELLEEEARAQKNLRILEAKKQKTNTFQPKKIELPPKRKVEMVESNTSFESDCDCGPNDACNKCIETKDY